MGLDYYSPYMETIKRIGIFSSIFALESTTLKHVLLYCDEIGIPNLEGIIQKQIPNLKDEQSAQYLYLRENGLIKEIPITKFEWDVAKSWIPMQPRPFADDEAKEYFSTANEFTEGRCAKLKLLAEPKGQCVPIDLYPNYNALLRLYHSYLGDGGKIENSNSTKCLNILLKQLPVPGEDISLEDLLDFRSQPETIQKRNLLLNWLNTKLDKDIDPQKFVDELACLLGDYRQYIQNRKRKFNSKVAETIIKLPLQLIENLLKLQLSETASELFELRAEYLDLKKAELEAPGREVAYILNAQERFSNK
jgi:hypothetical protein